tara:strand:+ start:903 stop:2306 length:1404 start_codon:yes stop_codon:yes gene_type:complete
MFRLLLISFVVPISVVAQLESFLSISSFNSNEGPYIETYLSVNSNTLKLIKNSESFYSGKVSVLINIYSNDSLYFSDKYILESPNYIFENNNNLFFIDQQRIKLNNGYYIINVDIKDENQENDINVIKYTKEMYVNYLNISISDIQLIERYEKADSINFLTKNGYNLYPTALNFYPKSYDSLLFYFEIYNTNTIREKKYLINTYIENFDNGKKLSDYYKFFRENSSDLKGKILNYNIKNLQTGNYNLVCEIRDFKNRLICTKKKFFQRSNNLNNKNRSNIIINDMNFSRDITIIDTLKKYIDYLYPISNTKEDFNAKNQLKYNNIELMQNYFYEFWFSRNPNNPFFEWQNYLLQVKSVNKAFKNQKKQGYLTDRGRVYLQYGAPNSINKADDPSSTYPYEIWHYYKLNNQSNKKFVFVNKNPATNEFRLIYSNVTGESTNLEWIRKIEQNEMPELGNDFKDNYLNPR